MKKSYTAVILLLVLIPVHTASARDNIGKWLDQMKGINPALLGETELAETSRKLDESWRNLIAAGRPAAQRIRAELKADPDDAYFQLSAAMVLYQIDRRAADADVIEVLERTSIDDNASQYFYLCHRIARTRNPAILPVLTRLLGNRTRVVFIDDQTEMLDPQMIVTYLFGVYGLESLDTLFKAVSDEDSAVRANAAALMGYFGDESALFVLADLLTGDADEHVRAAAASALGQLDHPSAIKPLEETLQRDRNMNVRAAITLALGEVQLESCIDPLSIALIDNSTQVRQLAAVSLAHVGHERGAARIINRLKIESEPDVRLAMIRALGRIGHDSAKETLEALVKSDDVQESFAAAESLRWMEVFGPASREPYPGRDGERLRPGQLQSLLKKLIENHGIEIEQHARTIFMSAKSTDLPVLEELRRSILMVVNNDTFDRLSDAGKLIRLVRRQARGLL